jgi:DNA repair protein RadA/Sms
LIITAVLTRRVGIQLVDQDIFINVVGGMQVKEPAADLALAAAIASSARDRPLPPDLALIGEVGLSGELRRVPNLEPRLREAVKLGFSSVVLPRRAEQPVDLPPELKLHEMSGLSEALSFALKA